MIRVNNVIFDREKVTCIWQDEKDVNKVTLLFDNGETHIFTGPEAMELWRVFDDDKGWREPIDKQLGDGVS